MIVALDIDDTITKNVPFFSFLSQALLEAGHQVIIITFREDRDATAQDLQSWGIGYTHLVTSTLEEHLECGVLEWKAEKCREHAVDVFFEDDPGVLSHVSPSVTSFLAVDHDRHDLDRTGRESPWTVGPDDLSE